RRRLRQDACSHHSPGALWQYRRDRQLRCIFSQFRSQLHHGCESAGRWRFRGMKSENGNKSYQQLNSYSLNAIKIMKALRIAIIIGSARPGRNGEAVAKWVHEIAQKRTDAEFELVDIKDFNLPLLDEPIPPIMGQYSKSHTKGSAVKIGSFDSYVFVTAEY